MTLLESRGKLDTPLDTCSIHLEEGDSHQVDDYTGYEGEAAFPDLFGFAPKVGEFGVELT